MRYLRRSTAIVEVVDELLASRYDVVFRYVRRRAANENEAEEITQSVFAQAPRSPTLAWLYTVAQRRLIDAHRRKRNATSPLSEASDRAAEPQYGAEVAAALRKALTGLPAKQREVVVLRLVEGRPFAEIAATLGITEPACKMRFVRGLASVRDVFEKEGIEP
jgi:RNA polymerase sigma-70 factor (ECF subfamily)